MGRPNRVLSFMSQWGGNNHLQKSPPTSGVSTAPSSPSIKQPASSTNFSHSATALDSFNHERSGVRDSQYGRPSSRPSSRPMSMIQTYQPPVVEVGQDTLPELQRIFTFLNSHSNKLYQEGYFLKFNDTDSRGRPAADRKWQEFFVQLVGTILSLWDASELDTAGGDGEVLPTFINITDAAIHMIPSMTLQDGKKLDNILSVSTAASNKYLFHFDSYHALTQWCAGIRLAMYEHTTLQEAYTGALIAGKGKTLNNIRSILDRQCPVYDDWVRVRFGAGTPWRRCWCVVSPPDEKEYAKLQKSQKKTNIYNRQPVYLKGDVKFYDKKKVTKKSKPIATIKDAFSCYAIYPQSKPLIDSSTLVKIEGRITIHSNPESTVEGFVFVLPEARPAVSGFEVMLQYLFPVFDTFCLYGRPKKLIADVLDTRGLMFAMPSDRRYGYLEMWDVVGLINTDGSASWTDRQWRKQLKDLTSLRMSQASETNSIYSRSSRRNTVSRSALSSSLRGNLKFEDRGSTRSNPSTRHASPARPNRGDHEPQELRRAGTAPAAGPFAPPYHQRSVSEQVNGYKRHRPVPSPSPIDRIRNDPDRAPTPPPHGVYNTAPQNRSSRNYDISDGDESPSYEPQNLPPLPTNLSAPPQGPVDLPPTFEHASSQKPPVRPALPPIMRPNPAVDSATLHQMADATNAPFPSNVPLGVPSNIAAAGAAAAWRGHETLHSRRGSDNNANAQNGQQMYLGSNMRQSPVDHNSGSRLPPIPASPYVEHPEFVEHSNVYQPTAPPVPEHEELRQTRQSQECPRRSRPNSGSIPRKPVPGRSPTTSKEDDARSTTSSSLHSLKNNVISPEDLDALQYSESLLARQASSSSSRYDDDAVSTSTPDYASRASDEIQPRRVPERREDRPRSGILKMIGNPDYKPKPEKGLESAQASGDVPNIDFGPTYALGFDGKRPGTSGTMTQMMHDNGSSERRESPSDNPTEHHRLSYIHGKVSPNSAAHMRSSSDSPQPHGPRSVAWQPGMAMQNQHQHQHQHQQEKQMLDAEEWVMRRASQQPQTLVYGHGRSAAKTPPPFGRTNSGDWSQMHRANGGSSSPGRPPSRPLSRPQSRGAERLLDQRPVSLSAREQEQVARMTNTPLLDLSQSKHKQSKSTEGLTGYINFREKEKAAAKAGRQGHSSLMQAEIDRRTLQVQQKQMREQQQRQRQMMEMQQQQMNQQMAMAQSNYAPSMMGAPSVMGTPSVMGASGMMGPPSVMGMPNSPGTPQSVVGMTYSTPHQYSQQQYFPQPSPQMQIPGAWGTPSPQTPQGQYFSQQPATQPYGASFDQAQAAARYASQQPHLHYPPTKPRYDG